MKKVSANIISLRKATLHKSALASILQLSGFQLYHSFLEVLPFKACGQFVP